MEFRMILYHLFLLMMVSVVIMFPDQIQPKITIKISPNRMYVCM